MFDAIAGRYDLLNRILSLGMDQRWRKAASRALDLAPNRPARVLDVATGTGDLALEIARQFPLATVTGLDPSERMLAIARQKAVNRNQNQTLSTRLVLLAGDAQRLEFPDGYFDGATIAFGIRNVPDRLRGLREMRRVVRPGGKVVVLELAQPRRGWLALGPRFYIRVVVPLIGALLSGRREYRYLQRSIHAFPPANEFADLMQTAGLSEVRYRSMTFGAVTLFVGTVPLNLPCALPDTSTM